MRTHNEAAASGEIPRRLRATEAAERWDVSTRTAAEKLRAAVAAGVAKKSGRLIVGRWSELDSFFANGCQVPERRRKGAR